MCDLSPGDTTVSLSELYGNKKQLSKCHSVTSTIDGCRVARHGDESLDRRFPESLGFMSHVVMGEVLVPSFTSKKEVKLGS